MHKKNKRIMRDQMIGARIREMLAEKNMTQHALAIRIGLIDGTLSRYLHGDNPITPAVLRSIADVLGVTVEDLTEGLG